MSLCLISCLGEQRVGQRGSRSATGQAAPAGEDVSAPQDSASGLDDAGSPPDVEPPEADTGNPSPWTAPVYSGGSCPTLREGVNSGFDSGGASREFRLVLPDEPVGAPVLYTWHWLGGSAQLSMTTLGHDRLAAREGVIVVAPESDGHPYEWHSTDAPTNNPDLTLFDDILACLHEEYAVDLGRIYSTGMSAGGLWTTYLTLFRADRLAATAPLSGGVYANGYTSPAQPIPVMLTWGGPSDTYGPLSFHEASLDLSSGLQGDGHFVVECEHAMGHRVPPGAAEYTWRFLADHPKGIDPEPYLEGLPASFPETCRIPR